MNVFPVNVRTDQYLTALEVFCQPPCGPRMGRAACKVASILPVPSFLFSRVRADVGFA